MGTRDHGRAPSVAAARVTAGFMCAPEIGPKVRISATNTAPVASVLASRAIAMLPPASCSPIIPEPMTVARRNAVARASLTASRTTAAFLRGLWLHSANEGAHEFAFDLRQD